jgi:hypothetical protein
LKEPVAGPEDGEMGVAGEKGGWKRCFGGSEGRCFGENKETGTSKRRIWAWDNGLRPDSWENSSNTKISIRSALPRSFVGHSVVPGGCGCGNRVLMPEELPESLHRGDCRGKVVIRVSEHGRANWRGFRTSLLTGSHVTL